MPATRWTQLLTILCGRIHVRRALVQGAASLAAPPYGADPAVPAPPLT